MLKTGLNKIGLEVNDNQLKQFEIYYELLCEWNEKINLTAITQKEEVYLKKLQELLNTEQEKQKLKRSLSKLN